MSRCRSTFLVRLLGVKYHIILALVGYLLIIFEEDLVQNGMTVERVNQDVKTNEYGVKLMNMCDAADLCVLNGRAFKDRQGKFTFCMKGVKVQ